MRSMLIRRMFQVAGATCGLAYAVTVPPMQAPDEVAHCFRAYSVSTGACIPPALTPIPQSLREFGSSFPPHLENVRRTGATEIEKYLRMPLNDGARTGVVNVTANLYSCIPYIPAAMGTGAGRLLHLPPAYLLYFERLANLAAFLALTTLALRQLPGFQIPLMMIALMPMTLSQAASASIDGITFGTAFFLCAYVLKLARNPRVLALQPRHYSIWVILVIGASVCKADAWLTPLLALVPAAKFGSSWRKWAVIVASILLSVTIVSAWSYANRRNGTLWADYLSSRQIALADNAHFIADHPASFARAIGRSVGDQGHVYLTEFVGTLGWLAVSLPAWVVWMYSLTLVFSGFCAGEGIDLKAGHRLLCVG